jgi:hypothetical protein
VQNRAATIRVRLAQLGWQLPASGPLLPEHFPPMRMRILPTSPGGPAGGYYVGLHGSMPSPRPPGTESHHGVLARLTESLFPGVSRDKMPAVLLTREQHNVTREVYNDWVKTEAPTFAGPNGKPRVDWNRVTTEQGEALANRMFNAANVPKEVQTEYFRQWESFKFRQEYQEHLNQVNQWKMEHGPQIQPGPTRMGD